jgi:transcriptional regulator with XRE-family HTH domain
MGRNIREDTLMGKRLRETLAKNLKSAMARAGVRQEGVTELTGVTQSTVSRILKCETPLSLDLLEDLAKGLGMHPWELLVDDEETRAEVVRRYLRS